MDWPTRLARTSSPAYFVEEVGDASASSPTTMFAGMIAPEKPPLRMAKSTSSLSTSRMLKFGPFVRSPPETWPSGFEPWAAPASSVWQPLQRSLKSWAPCSSVGRVDLDLLRLATGEDRGRERGRRQGVGGSRAGILSAALCAASCP